MNVFAIWQPGYCSVWIGAKQQSQLAKQEIVALGVKEHASGLYGH